MGRAGWGAIFAVLIVATASCSSAPSIKLPAQDVGDARPIARELASILLTYSAYDYALIGALNADKVRAIDPDRYADVAQNAASLIAESTSKILSATVDTRGPIRDRLVKLADTMGDLRKDGLAYADARRPDSFARVITDVQNGWSQLHDLESLLVDDAQLDATIERGTAMKAAFAPSSGALLTMGPFASAEEAAQKATLLAGIGVPSTTSPFVVRASFNDRAAADAAAADLLKQHVIAIVIDRTSYTFTRSGPQPDVELWREPERSLDAHGAARKIALTPTLGLIATGSDDGFVSIFSADGVLRSLPQFPAGVNQLAFTDDAKWLMGGGQTLVTWPMPAPDASLGVGEPMRLRSATQSVLYVPHTNYFAASSAGGQDGNGVVGARTVDGLHIDNSPFPIDVEPAGAILAASDIGELFIASMYRGAATLSVYLMGRDDAPHGVLQVPGVLRAMAVDHTGTYGAMVTDQGTFRFGIKAVDPAKTVTKITGPSRDVEFGPDATLYVLEPTRVSAFSSDSTQKWVQPLTDGRRMAVAMRVVVLDGTDKLIAISPQNGTQDLLAPVGQVQDLVASKDGHWIGVIAGARRAVLFKFI
ncbi:MAG TPA: hypothetical protein VI814_05375 [Candidatus Limnocylindria bacterium]